MPSPIGHSLAGAIVGLSAEFLIRRTRAPRTAPGALLGVCVALAIAPDLDLVYMPIHRTATHSVTAAVVTMIIAAGVTRQVTARVDWAVALACGAAVGSHVLCDWLGQDFSHPRGIQALWPWSDEWFVSEWDVFRRTERRDILSWATTEHNVITALQELVLLGPPAALVWWLTRRVPRSASPPTDRDASGTADSDRRHV